MQSKKIEKLNFIQEKEIKFLLDCIKRKIQFCSNEI